MYNLAAETGGIGCITAYRAPVAHNKVLINAHLLEASRINAASRFFSRPQRVSIRRTAEKVPM